METLLRSVVQFCGQLCPPGPSSIHIGLTHQLPAAPATLRPSGDSPHHPHHSLPNACSLALPTLCSTIHACVCLNSPLLQHTAGTAGGCASRR
jgi:hypothetical protein